MEEAGARELCTYINSALQSIKRVVHGTALLTPAIQATGGALIAGKVSNAVTCNIFVCNS
jgi:hypothetical protein